MKKVFHVASYFAVGFLLAPVSASAQSVGSRLSQPAARTSIQDLAKSGARTKIEIRGRNLSAEEFQELTKSTKIDLSKNVDPTKWLVKDMELTEKRDILRSKAKRGTESSGGGSTERKLFYDPLARAMKILNNGRGYLYENVLIKYDEIEAALRAVTIIPTNDQLFDRQGQKVNFLNDPQALTVNFNMTNWISLDLKGQIQFGLHELLGILEIPDPFYRISAQLAELAMKGIDSKNNFSEAEVLWVRDLDPRINPIYMMTKALRDDGVISAIISYECKQYSTRHRGPCLVITYSPTEDNAYNTKRVYLIDLQMANTQILY